MILQNLENTHWMNIDCNTQGYLDVFCFGRKKNSDRSVKKNFVNSHFCKELMLKLNGSCLSFSWENGNRSKNNGLKQADNVLNIFMFLFGCVDALNLPPVFDKDFSHFFHFLEGSSILQYEQQSIVGNVSHYALTVRLAPAIKFKAGSNLLFCSSGYFVSASVKGLPDTCMTWPALVQNLVDSELYTTMKHFTTHTIVGKLTGWHFSNGKTNHSVNDNLTTVTGANDFERKCEKFGMLSCSFENRACYSVSDICSYLKSESGALTPCKSGEHMQNCSLFQCNNMFKCPNFYCIPWGYVCDGKWDCPAGTDEDTRLQYNSRNCSSMFRCKSSQKCLHLLTVCDKVFDCPFQDDEKLCILHKQVCPYPCVCLAVAMSCNAVEISKQLLQKEHAYFALGILRCSIFSPFQLNFPYLAFLSITSSNLTNICGMSSKSKLLMSLNYSENHINILSRLCFLGNQNLIIIDLSQNCITKISTGAFRDLLCLQYLDLSQNYISSIKSESNIATSLKVLWVDTVQHPSRELFQCTELEYFQTKDYHLCCLLDDGSVCSERKPWFFNCNSLLPNTTLEIWFCCVSFVIFLLSSISMLLHRWMFTQGLNKMAAFGTIVAWVNCSDIVFALSLTMLWSFDVYYADHYFLEDINWRSGFPCFFCFAIVQNFLILHPLLLVFLSLSRFMVVRYPLHTPLKQTRYVRRVLAKITLGCVTLCSTATFSTWLTNQKRGLPTFLCSPFLDSTESILFIDIFTWFVSVYVSVGSVSTALINTLLGEIIADSQNEFAKSTGHRRKFLTLQLALLTASCILCWTSSSAFFLTSTFIVQYPMELAVWVHAAVLPINSIVWPTIFVAVTIRKIKTYMFASHWTDKGSSESRKTDTLACCAQ